MLTGLRSRETGRGTNFPSRLPRSPPTLGSVKVRRSWAGRSSECFAPAQRGKDNKMAATREWQYNQLRAAPRCRLRPFRRHSGAQRAVATVLESRSHAALDGSGCSCIVCRTGILVSGGNPLIYSLSNILATALPGQTCPQSASVS